MSSTLRRLKLPQQAPMARRALAPPQQAHQAQVERRPRPAAAVAAVLAMATPGIKAKATKATGIAAVGVVQAAKNVKAAMWRSIRLQVGLTDAIRTFVSTFDALDVLMILILGYLIPNLFRFASTSAFCS